jgi:hypothetical protein
MMTAATGRFFCEAMMMMACRSFWGTLSTQVMSVLNTRKQKCCTMAAATASMMMKNSCSIRASCALESFCHTMITIWRLLHRYSAICGGGEVAAALRAACP